MLFVPSATEYQWSVSNRADGLQPIVNPGTTITSGTANTKGTWTQLLSSAQVTEDIYGVFLEFNTGYVSAAARLLLADIGVDNAGGTAYLVKIPDLFVPGAGQMIPTNVRCGAHQFFFPLKIKAGSSIGCRLQGATASSTVNCLIKCFGQPSNPESVKVGSFVQAFGINTATTEATAITPGTTTEGAWVQLGGALTEPLWYWQAAFGSNLAAVVARNGYHVDIGVGDATNKITVVENQLFITDTAEAFGTTNFNLQPQHKAPPNTLVYGRAQCSGTPETNIQVAAYGLGG